jgi:hypothetical protein
MLLYSLLQELGLVLHYIVVMLLVLIVFQDIVCWMLEMGAMLFLVGDRCDQ